MPNLETLAGEIQELYADGTAILCDEVSSLRQFDARHFTPSILGSFAAFCVSTALALSGLQGSGYDSPMACCRSSMQFFHSSPPGKVCRFALKRV